jgi:sec-independent protein translocase protein TatC
MDAVNTNQLEKEEELGGQMSFLDHLDELRRRLVRAALIIAVAFVICFYFSKDIYNFLSVPVIQAIAEAQRQQLPAEGLTGEEKFSSLSSLKEGDKGRYVFNRITTLGGTTIPNGASVNAVVTKDKDGKIGLYSEEPIYSSWTVIPAGVRLVDLSIPRSDEPDADAKLIVTTALEPFTLYMTVSLYAAIALSIPFLLLQVWGFIAPALYQHEKKYVTPFIFLSTISFVIGAAFAYYILFPPAVKYLLGLGSNFDLMLRATDYFDFITLIMLAMGIIFQMPAITYVLARIGIVSAKLLVRSWKIAVVVILIVAAVVSPTGDIPNMMLFATPMLALYCVSIFVAWFFGKKRTTDEV